MAGDVNLKKQLPPSHQPCDLSAEELVRHVSRRMGPADARQLCLSGFLQESLLSFGLLIAELLVPTEAVTLKKHEETSSLPA